MKKLICIIITYLSLQTIGHTQAGVLDLSFDVDGISTTPFGSINRATAILVQSDGKLVVAGTSLTFNYQFTVKRLNTDGSLDNSFNGGFNVVDFGGADEVSCAALQPDGKIIIAGYSAVAGTNDFSLARLNSDGTMDNSFDADGKVTTAIGSGLDRIASIALQPDGKIVVSGWSNNGVNSDFALARYNTDGSLDNSFDLDGKLTTALGSGTDEAYAVVIQPDGKILAGGTSNIGGTSMFALVRYNTNGSLDVSFDTDGIVTTNFGNQINALALQPDGRIVAAGGGFCLARYNTDGSLDNSFDGDGMATSNLLLSNSGTAESMLLQPDGKIVTAGYVLNGSYLDFSLTRHHTDGTIDSSFDADGILISSIGMYDDRAYSIAQQVDGKYVVAGETGNGTNPDFTTVRYISCSIPPTVVAHSNALNNAICLGDAVILTGSGANAYNWTGGITDAMAFTPLTTQTYTVTGTDVGGCSNTDSISIVVNPLPNVSVTQTSATLTANATGVGYQWIDCNNANANIPGATNQSFIAATNGNYAVIINQNGCTDTSACITVNTVGVENVQVNFNIQLFPNPATETILITTNQPLENATLKVIDLHGKIILSNINQNGSQILLDVLGWSNGVYIIEVEQNNIYMRSKIIKN